jgi:hypothetical protein
MLTLHPWTVLSVLQTWFMLPQGVDDMAVAMNVLEATNWQLEDAINLQFATGTWAVLVLEVVQEQQEVQTYLPWKRRKCVNQCQSCVTGCMETMACTASQLAASHGEQ